jgi:NAD+ synthase
MARLLGTPTEQIDITPMVDACYRRDPRASRRRRGNMMARIRMTLLYDRAMRDERLVIGTSNKTELLLGYGTHYGDMASALNPLGDLYKTQVRLVAQRLGVPDAILRKTPTADLWAGQSDEEELGYAYNDLDRLLLRLVEMRDSPESMIAGGFPRRMVDDVRRRLVGSQFKRRPPVIAKLSRRAINIDFRYPRDWGS